MFLNAVISVEILAEVGMGEEGHLESHGFGELDVRLAFPPYREWCPPLLSQPQALTTLTPEPPVKQACQGLYVSPSQLYCASTRRPPRCKTFQLHTTLLVGDPRGSGEGGGGRQHS